jgi:hypothetical protein
LTFPANDELDAEDKRSAAIDKNIRQVQWHYHLQWQTPQQLGEMLQTWRNYFFTGHVPLLLQIEQWNVRQIQFDDFSKEGADAIAELLSLIFCYQEAAIQNATWPGQSSTA